MLKHEFCDDCPGCRPALLDIQTGRIMANDTPIMIAINHVWDTGTTYEERKAFIDVTYNHSEKEADQEICKQIMERFQTKLNELEKES